MNKKAQAWIAEILPFIICNWSESIESWLTKRVGLMTGSKVGGALGYSSYMTPLQLMAEFQYPERVEPVEKYSSSWLRMEIGSLAEEPIRKVAEADPARPGRYESIENTARLIRHPEYEWAACSPDGLAWSEEYGRVLIEIKNTNIGTMHQYKTDDGSPCVPSNYKAQVLWNMACVGADVGILIANFNGDIKYRVVERNEQDIEMLFSKAETFLRAVETQDASMLMDIIEGASAMNKTMNELFRQSSGAEFSVSDPEIDSAIEECIDVKRRIKELDERKDGLEAQIKRALATSRVMETSKYRVSWGQGQGRAKFDRKSFSAAHPDLAQQYTQDGLPYRTGLRMTQRKER
jgi:predicted phage-related endonuclease